MAAKAMARDVSGAMGATSDNLASHYSAKAENCGPKEREAAMLFSVAENHLNQNEDYAEGLRAAKEALTLFKEVGDRIAVADTLRLVVHAHRVKAEIMRSATGEDQAERANAALDEAESLAQEELAKFREGSDKRSIGAMLLSIAEVNYSQRGAEKREQALSAAAEARGIFREVQETKLEAVAIYTLSNVYSQKLMVKEALQAGQDALQLFRSLADRKTQAKCLHLLAIAHMLDEELQKAIGAATDALQIFRELDSKKLIAFELYNIAGWFLSAEKPKEALSFAREAALLFQELKYGKGWQAVSLALIVQALVDSGDVRQALDVGSKGLKGFEASGDTRGVVFAFDALAHAHLASSDRDQALASMESAIQACRSIGDKRWESQLLCGKSAVHSRSQDWDKAVQAAQDAQALAIDLGDKELEADICSGLARMRAEQGDYEAALAAADTHRQIFEETGDKTKETFALLELANIKGMRGEVDEGLTQAHQALDMFRNIGHQSGEGSALQLIAEMSLATGDVVAALQAAEEMFDASDKRDNPKMKALAKITVAKIRLAEGNLPQDALAAAIDALKIVRKAELKRLQVEVMNLAAECHFAAASKEASKGDPSKSGAVLRRGAEKALKLSEEAVKIAKKLNDKALVAASMYLVGSALMVFRRTADALKAANEAAEIFQKIGDKASEVACTILRGEVQAVGGKPSKAIELLDAAMTAAKACGDEMGEHRARTLKEKLQQGTQPTQSKAAVVAQSADTAPAASAGAPAAAVEEAPGLEPAQVEKMVMEIASSVIGSGDDLTVDSPLMDSGLDSLSSVAFRNDLQRAIGFKISAALIFDYPTPAQIVEHLVEVSKTKK